MNNTINFGIEKVSENELHENFKKYGTNAKEWLRKCALLLPEIDRLRIWERKGFASIFEYASKLAGMSKSQVYVALQVMGKIENKPELRKVVEERGINAVKSVVSIATAETDAYWAEVARTMSVHAQETLVREIRNIPKKQNIQNELFNHVVKNNTNFQLTEAIEESKKKILIMELKKENAEKPEKVETNSRHVPVKIEKHINQRNNNKCEFPGCQKPYKILHHIDRFGLKKEHDPDKIVGLCEGHERLAHSGLIENEQQSPENWKIRLEADKNLSTYKIDEKVMEFRRPVKNR